MGIYLGNLSVEQIEKRAGITLSDEHRDYMKAHRQEYIDSINHILGEKNLLISEQKSHTLYQRDTV